MTSHPESALVLLNEARNDLRACKDEFDSDKPVAETISFHMQKAIEKYLKSYLVFSGHEIETIHDMAGILEMCRSIDPEFSLLTDAETLILASHGEEIHKHDLSVSMPAVTSEAIMLADRVKDFVEDKLTDLGLDINLGRV